MKNLILSFLSSLMFIPCVGQVKREGNMFIDTTKTIKLEPFKTKYTYKLSTGKILPIYVSNTGACYVEVISKNNKKYYKYLQGEIKKIIREDPDVINYLNKNGIMVEYCDRADKLSSK